MATDSRDVVLALDGTQAPTRACADLVTETERDAEALVTLSHGAGAVVAARTRGGATTIELEERRAAA
ncbi:MAG: hypothetical protein H6831_12840 [Planctomycetes bacterium]|nr:hypothetical protein [Planctomycetota bacterium]